MVTSATSSNRCTGRDRTRGIYLRKMISYTATALLLGPCGVSNVQAQTTYAPVVMAAPIEDAVDENHVSLLTGKLHFSIPGVSLGDVSFAAHAFKSSLARFSFSLA